jgi:hydroxymethylpyrimidine pyrophosphatase-like HAD family hydrolase
MYCRVLACDFDGTGATNGHPAPELYAALGAAQAQGVTLLVTGRVLEDVQRAFEEFSPFDAVVAENGAVVYLCSVGRTIIAFNNPLHNRFRKIYIPRRVNNPWPLFFCILEKKNRGFFLFVIIPRR